MDGTALTRLVLDADLLSLGSWDFLRDFNLTEPCNEYNQRTTWKGYTHPDEDPCR